MYCEKTLCGLSISIFLIIYCSLYLIKPRFIMKKNIYGDSITDNSKLFSWSIFITSFMALISLLVYNHKCKMNTFAKDKSYSQDLI